MNQHFAELAEREASMESDDPPERWPGPAYSSDSSDKPDASSKPSLLQPVRAWLRHILNGKSHDSLKDVLEEVLEEHEEEAARLAPQEKAMLKNVLAFGDRSVSDIMVPRTDIIAVPHDITLEGLKHHILESRHTRIPVYRGTLDQVEGFLHIKDLFPMIAGDEEFNLQNVMRPMLFVPPSMRILDLLVKMRRLASHMAIVVDEYGGTDGLVTLEDVFEEIVGDIQDEHDEEQDKEIVRHSPTSYDVDARVRIDRLEDMFAIKLKGEEEDFDTLGGLLFFELGHVPARGERIKHESGVTFEVLDADSRRVRKVRLLGVPTLEEERV